MGLQTIFVFLSQLFWIAQTPSNESVYLLYFNQKEMGLPKSPSETVALPASPRPVLTTLSHPSPAPLEDSPPRSRPVASPTRLSAEKCLQETSKPACARARARRVSERGDRVIIKSGGREPTIEMQNRTMEERGKGELPPPQR